MVQIVHLKLVNGEQLVGQLKKQTKKKTTIIRPLSVRVMVDPDHQSQSIGLFQYSELANVDLVVQFFNDHIITIIPTSDEISSVYLSTVEKLCNTEKPKQPTTLENTSEQQLEQLAEYLNKKPVACFPPFTKKVH